jgi:hypothetical protein
LLQIVARLIAPGPLGQLRGIDAGEPYADRLAVLASTDRVTVTDREHDGLMLLS